MLNTTRHKHGWTSEVFDLRRVCLGRGSPIMLDQVSARRLGAALGAGAIVVIMSLALVSEPPRASATTPEDFKAMLVRLNDDRTMPTLGLGTFRLKPGDTTYNAVYSALSLGIRHIDTADAYNNEADIGRAVEVFTRERDVPREQIFITTKLPFGGVKTYEEALAALRGSLKKLGMQYVDLYLIHNPHGQDAARRMAQWDALTEAKRLGLAKSIGVSDYKADALRELVKLSTPPAVLQIEVSPWLASERAEELALCELYGIQVVAWGAMTGPKGKGEGKKFEDPKVLQVVEEFDPPGEDAASILLRWSLQRGFAPIVTSTSRLHQASNLAVAQGYSMGEALSPSAMAMLGTLAEKPYFSMGADLARKPDEIGGAGPVQS